jgi:hypothetical protein
MPRTSVEQFFHLYDEKDLNGNSVFVEQTDGSFDHMGNFSFVEEKIFEEFPIQFNIIHGSFILTYSYIKSTKCFPRKVEGDVRLAGTKIKSLEGITRDISGNFVLPKIGWNEPEVYIPVLFIKCFAVMFGRNDDTLSSQRIAKILTDGRVNRQMPRELIPGKINELRDLKR